MLGGYGYVFGGEVSWSKDDVCFFGEYVLCQDLGFGNVVECGWLCFDEVGEDRYLFVYVFYVGCEIVYELVNWWNIVVVDGFDFFCC